MRSAAVAVALIVAGCRPLDEGPCARQGTRVRDRPHYRAPDGSISFVRYRDSSPVRLPEGILPEPGAVVLRWTTDVACVRAHSVEHARRADTLAVTLFADDPPGGCPAIYVAGVIEVRVRGLPPGGYVLQIWREGCDREAMLAMQRAVVVPRAEPTAAPLGGRAEGTQPSRPTRSSVALKRTKPLR